MQPASGVLPSVAEHMLASVFGVAAATYRDQPAVLHFTTPPTAADLRTAIANNPMRPIWIDGDLVIDSAGDIGSAANPVVIVVNGGNLTFASNVKIYGAVFVMTPSWVTGGTGTIQGAAVASTGLGGNGNGTYVYDRALLENLRLTSGSFVIVPGSWKDYAP
jgi:hypothetical protein